MTASRPSKPTLDDVAALSRTSRATVSRVLNGGVRSAAGIDPGVREAVLAAARELDYAPNSQAQAMAAGGSKTVAVLVSEIDDVGAAAMVDGATRKARERGYSVTVGLAGLTAADEIEAVRAIRGQRPHALVIAVSRTIDQAREQAFDDELTAFAKAGGRVSVIGHNSFTFDEVIFRNAESASALAAALVDRGYRRFAVVTGDTDQLTPRERHRGFAQTLSSRGIQIDPDLVFTGEFDREGGFRAAGRLAARVDDAEVVFATSDAMALGVVARLRHEGISIPQQIAVAGFDDVPVVRDLTPPLSTVRVPLEALAMMAVEQALDAHPQRASIEVTGDVVLRASTPALS